MKAVQVVTPTGPADVRVRDVDAPEPGPHDVLVEVHSVGVAFPDLLLSRGEYQFRPEPPFTLGVDFAGVVLDPGSPESSGFTVGQRVAGVNLHGGAAEQVANPAIFTFALPDALSYDEGAALPMNYLTALFALEERGGLRDRETVLVHGAAGGVGTASLQVAKGLGARTIAVVSTEEKAAFARAAGADEVVVGPDFKDAVKELTGGKGVDVVLDVVGGDAFTDSLRVLAEQGRVLVVGFAVRPGHPGGQGQPAAAQQHRRPRRRVGCLRDDPARLHAEAVAPPRPDDRVGRREAADRRDLRARGLRAGARRHGRAPHPRQVGRPRALRLSAGRSAAPSRRRTRSSWPGRSPGPDAWRRTGSCTVPRRWSCSARQPARTWTWATPPSTSVTLNDTVCARPLGPPTRGRLQVRAGPPRTGR